MRCSEGVLPLHGPSPVPFLPRPSPGAHSPRRTSPPVPPPWPASCRGAWRTSPTVSSKVLISQHRDNSRGVDNTGVRLARAHVRCWRCMRSRPPHAAAFCLEPCMPLQAHPTRFHRHYCEITGVQHARRVLPSERPAGVMPTIHSLAQHTLRCRTHLEYPHDWPKQHRLLFGACDMRVRVAQRLAGVNRRWWWVVTS